MQSTIKKLQGSEIEISFEVPFEELKLCFPKAAQDLSQSINIPGFRPGKAPLSEVRKYVSEFSLIEKAAGYAIQDAYAKTIEEKNIEAVGNPSVEITKLAYNNPLVFKAKVAQIPDIQLPDWKKIAYDMREKEKEHIEVSEKELDEAMRYLQRSRRTFHVVERPCQNGDRVEITFEASENGVPQEGISSKNHPLMVGEKRFLPGFEEELVGLKKGETKDFMLHVPSDWWQKTLSGKTLVFHVALDQVEEIHEPELNDDFAKAVGNFQNMEALGASVKERIKEEKEAKEKERLCGLTLEAIRKKSPFEVPRVLVASEQERLLHELTSSIEGLGLRFNEYLERANKTEDDIKEEIEKEAEKRVSVGFILRAIAKAADITPEEKEIEERMNRELLRYDSRDEGKKNIDRARLKEYIKGVLKNEKALQLLYES